MTYRDKAIDKLQDSYMANDTSVVNERHRREAVEIGDEEAANTNARAVEIDQDFAHLCAEQAQANALLAIEEQLRVANFIALSNAPDGASESTDTGNGILFNSEDTSFGRSYHGLKPNIAAILGIVNADTDDAS